MYSKSGDVESICSYIKEREELILSQIELRDMQIYSYIQTEFNKGSVAENYVFQAVFNSYYGLDSAKLSAKFKSKYFSLMDSCRDKKDLDAIVVCESLIDSNNGSFQFSFATKLVHTINPNYPIYDRYVALYLGLNKNIYGKELSLKKELYRKLFCDLSQVYLEVTKHDHLKSIIGKVKCKFPWSNISTAKMLDFIFWRAGKIKEAEEKEIR